MSQTVLRLSAVIEVTGLSKSTIYALIKLGDFPLPIKLGERSVGWLESEVQDWLSARMAMRGGMKGEPQPCALTRERGRRVRLVGQY